MVFPTMTTMTQGPGVIPNSDEAAVSPNCDKENGIPDSDNHEEAPGIIPNREKVAVSPN